MEEYQFDLTKYEVEVTTVMPYFEVIKDMGLYRIYSGTLLGRNRFGYFEISNKSNAAKLYKKFDKKYNYNVPLKKGR